LNENENLISINEKHRKIFEKLKNSEAEDTKKSKNQQKHEKFSKEITQENFSQDKIAEINKAEENEIESAVSLLKNPRSLDNSLFRGYEASAQENDTLDILEQIKKNLQENKSTLEKLKNFGLSSKDITKNKIVKPGQFPNLKGAEVIVRTKESLTLIKGRSLFIYELKRLELQAPSQGNPGEKLNLKWPAGQEKASATQALEIERHHSRSRTQSEDMK